MGLLMSLLHLLLLYFISAFKAWSYYIDVGVLCLSILHSLYSYMENITITYKSAVHFYFYRQKYIVC